MTEIMAIWKQQKIQICIGIEFPKSPEKKFGRNLLFYEAFRKKKAMSCLFYCQRCISH